MTARVQRDLAEWLDKGETLADALRRSYQRCPGDALALVAAAEPIHQLPRALHALQDDLVERCRIRQSTISTPYFVGVVTMVLLLITGVLTFVVPKFEVLFSDMGVALPTSTALLMMASQLLWNISAATPFILIFGIIPLSLYLWIRPRRPDKPYLFSRMADGLRWHVPGLRHATRLSCQAQTARFLRLALEGGIALDRAVELASTLDMNIAWRDRLAEWARLIRDGQDPGQAAQQAGLGRSLAWAFHGQSTPSQAGDILTVIETNSQSRVTRMQSLARQIISPLLMLTLAGLVGLIVLALFAPLCTMLTVTNGNVYP